jgi:hypothetical protein
VVQSAISSPDCSRVSVAIHNILRDFIDREASCVAAHKAAASLFENTTRGSAQSESVLGYGGLVLAVNVLHTVDVSDRQESASFSGSTQGRQGVLQLSVALRLGSEAAVSGMPSSFLLCWFPEQL